MEVNSRLKRMLAATSIGIVFGSAVVGVERYVCDAQDYQKNYPSLSIRDAEALSRKEAGVDGIIAGALLIAAILPGMRQKEKSAAPKAP